MTRILILISSIVVAANAPAAIDLSRLPPAAGQEVDFVRDVQPIFAAACVKCHGPEKQKSDYRLDVKSSALTKGEIHAPNIIPGKSAESPLIHFVAGLITEMQMPPKDPPLKPEQIGALRRWIDDGAVWPDEASAKVTDKRDWWSLKPIVKSPAPGKGGIDGFLIAKLAEKGLAMSPQADARTLIRRLYFDLIGLPPSPEEVTAFETAASASNGADAAYAGLVDKLLASPRYGERWARHWLDVVHYGETHGYDKDQPRPNAWPYRDYVIRAFNEDRPYTRFIQEQLAGDVLFPNTRDGVEALGFIAAGPWDLIGHAEVPEDKLDGKIARHLDRDDMVANTMSTFASLTVHCAQCHDHKFDPVSAEDYYSLQSVFAALDRADRSYDTDAETAQKRKLLTDELVALKGRAEALRKKAVEKSGDVLVVLDKQIEAMKKPAATMGQKMGWHSQIAPRPDVVKWVQIDLGKSVGLEEVSLHPCHDNFAGIGDGFGFPVRYKVEMSNHQDFSSEVTVVADETKRDFVNPKIKPVTFPAKHSARYIRVTATQLVERQKDYIFALAEISVKLTDGSVGGRGAVVNSLDSIEAPERWARENLTDGWYPGAELVKSAVDERAVRKMEEARRIVFQAALGDADAAELTRLEAEMTRVGKALAALPKPQVVYSGTVHQGSGTFIGTGAKGGLPRAITVLARGDVKRPGKLAIPGAIQALAPLAGRFNLPESAPEGQRRAALAEWLTNPANPLTWRSIVNRVWQYHFGKGLVETSNDFGRMGGLPTHPELLDWLAATFRDDMGGSLKQLHRSIVTSAAYRQSSAVNSDTALQADGDNRLLWRQNRRRIDAESVRDGLLQTAGKLDLTMGGPGFQDFVVERPEHSPHYQYHLMDAENPAIYRRSIYRFLVRSQQQPWMAALDCADPSMLVEKRNETITPLQALAQMNNQLVIVLARHLARRVEASGGVDRAFLLAVQRQPTEVERKDLAEYVSLHGLENGCRLILNLNEFVFVD